MGLIPMGNKENNTLALANLIKGQANHLHTTKTTNFTAARLIEPSLVVTLLRFLEIEERAREKMSRKAGDWICRSCQYDNFCWRESCQRCKKAKVGGDEGDRGSGNASWDVKPGDWRCACGVHNFASRPSCFKCGRAATSTTTQAGWNASGATHRGIMVRGTKSRMEKEMMMPLIS
ncbi:hypothetical protein C4D60_Mb04t08660 [Musa balbisiana]|uniref:RanBP2-type domain-containing protein n=1 Tax=Musa balbisiana TaxID=52838 RepID=A0A4S8KAL0_MUSBA|nr:hypothetical protein C4D60_Mb04t08660 [Musa balbisiana]